MRKWDKEYYQIIEMFEKFLKSSCIYGRVDKEDKHNDKLPPDAVYQDGTVNKLFISFINGYTLGKDIKREELRQDYETLIESIQHYNSSYEIEDKVAEFLINNIKMLGK